MLTHEEIQRQVQILSKTVIDKLKELDPKSEGVQGEVLGIAIFMFPEDHAKNGHINFTAIGKVCGDHIIKCVVQEIISREGVQNPLAT
jgi:hypothetical protein